jgi:hypothetical protein
MTSASGTSGRRWLFAAAGLLVLMGAAGFYALRGRHNVVAPPPSPSAKGTRIDFLSPSPIGEGIATEERPLIAHVSIADLDRDGIPDVIVADATRGGVFWIRQSPRGTFTETVLANVAAPAHVQVFDIDKDGDLDLAVASLGVLFPNNAKIGAIIIFENDGAQHFTEHVVAEQVARVADVRAGDLDGDGDLDLSAAHFGYDDGETAWMENLGNWKFARHVLQSLSGPINAEIVDVDGDSDLDIVSLVSQEWEEVYAFVNDGKGHFTPTLLYGASNEDFGSSWISVVDLDRDGDADVLYGNGDALDYAPMEGRVWNGLQWLENTGGVKFVYHRLADLSGASSPQAADMDGDGDLDIVVVSAYNDWDRADAQSVVWLQNDGHMNFTFRDIANTPTRLITLAIGDLDADGHPDLITGSLHASGSTDRMSRVTMWTNRWPGTATPP